MSLKTKQYLSECESSFDGLYYSHNGNIYAVNMPFGGWVPMDIHHRQYKVNTSDLSMLTNPERFRKGSRLELSLKGLDYDQLMYSVVPPPD